MKSNIILRSPDCPYKDPVNVVTKDKECSEPPHTLVSISSVLSGMTLKFSVTTMSNMLNLKNDKTTIIRTFYYFEENDNIRRILRDLSGWQASPRVVHHAH